MKPKLTAANTNYTIKSQSISCDTMTNIDTHEFWPLVDAAVK